MSNGWMIVFQGRQFKVAVDDQDEALAKVIEIAPDATGVVVLPLKDGEKDQIGLADGEVRETTGR